MGNLDEAKADLERVLELSADNKDAVREEPMPLQRIPQLATPS